MIICFAGTPGSGKTYDAVKKVLDNLKIGRRVYTNIEGLDAQRQQEFIKVFCGIDDAQLAECLVFLKPDQINNFWEHTEDGALVVLDEVHKNFSNRDWQSQKNKGFAEWASTHRHQGYDVVLITQDTNKIDAHARTLVEWTYVYRKVNFFGGAVSNKYLCYAYASEETTGAPLTKSVKTYDKRIFQCYKSYVAADVKELGIMKHANILKHPVFFIIPVVICFFLYMLIGKSSLLSGDILGSKTALAKAHPIQQQEASGPAQPESDIKKTEVIDNVIDRAPVSEPEPEFYIEKLNYLKKIDAIGDIVYRILWRGGLLPLDRFPYTVEVRDGELYAQIPLGAYDEF